MERMSPAQGGQVDQTGALLRLAEVVRRRKLIVLEAIVLVPILAVLMSLQQKPLHEAASTVLVSNKDLAGALTGTGTQLFYPEADRFVQTQARIAANPTVAERVLEAAGLPGRDADVFLGASSVTSASDSDLLVFTVQDAQPEVAARLSGAYAREYIRFRQELDTSAITSARTEIRKSLSELRARGGDQAQERVLLDKDEQLRTLGALQAANAFVITEATGAYQIRPTPVRNGMYGLIIGLILGLGAAFIWDALDSRVRDADDLTALLGLPLLARIPRPDRGVRNDLVMRDAPLGASAEAFRLLKTNIDFVNAVAPVQRLFVTSAVESEGKSTTALNLAVAMARAGMRVVLVDLDLRRPTLHTRLETSRSPGFTDTAIGAISLEEAMLEFDLRDAGADPRRLRREEFGSVMGSLRVVPAGTAPPSAGEFMGGRAALETLARLGEHGEVVIVDTPPVLRVSDAMGLMRPTDSVLVVARQSRARRRLLKELRRVLAAVPSRKIGYVLTDPKGMDAPSYGYYSDGGDDEHAGGSRGRNPKAGRGAEPL